MTKARLWLALVSWLVPGAERAQWREEWSAELAVHGGSMTHAWGALPDAWYLRTEGWSMDAVWRDVRSAVIGLRRRPFFTAVAGVTLAVGIGATTAIYSVVDGVLINPLPYPDADRMVSYNHQAPGLGVSVPLIPHSEALYLHYQEHARALESFAVFTDASVNFVTEAEPRQLAASYVTQEYFEVTGAQPVLGRGFAVGEDRPGAEPVAVLSYPLWEQAFGRDRATLGALVEIDGVRRRIVGIMPEGFAFSDEELWLPLVIDDADPDVGSLGFIGVGRLAEGATIEGAHVEMGALLNRFAEENPDALSREILEQAGLAPDVKDLKAVFVEDVAQALWVLLGTVGFVLLIACANVANLFLVLADSRQREQAVRTAMGAGRGDLARQYISEALALAALGGVAGLGLAALGVRGLMRLAPADLPVAFDFGIDGSVLLFTAAIAVASGILFGVLPAVGGGARDLSDALKDGGRASTAGRERHRARSTLVVAQVALALVLLVGSGLMVRSFAQLRAVDPGFRADGLLTFRYALPEAEYADAGAVLDFHRRLTVRLEAIPGVEAVGMADGLPLTGAKSAGPKEPVDRPFPEDELGPVIEHRAVTPGFFSAMAVPVLEGRELTWEDRADGVRSAVISQALARQFWPDQSAVGRHIRDQGADASWEVVGVVGDVRHDDVQDEPMPVVYFPTVRGASGELEPSRSLGVVLRAADPLGAIDAARSALLEIDPRLPMIRARTMRSVVDDSMQSTSFTVLMLGIAAGIALLLGTVGIYGVISYIVSRRTAEIGVRMALGAQAATVLAQVLREGLRLTVIGVGVGLLGAWGVSRALASLLYGVSATDPLTFGGTALLLTGIALLATWVPARRAARVDPVQALRAE